MNNSVIINDLHRSLHPLLQSQHDILSETPDKMSQHDILSGVSVMSKNYYYYAIAVNLG